MCAVGVADFAWPLTRTMRAIIVVPIACGVLGVLIFVLWKLMARRRLTLIARDIERVEGGAGQNTLVTFAEKVESESAEVEGGLLTGMSPYMRARLERQAQSELARLDEKVVAPRRGVMFGAGACGLALVLMLLLRVMAPAVFALETRRVLWLERDGERTMRRGILNEAAAMNGNEASRSAAAIEAFRIRIVPPAYSGLAAEEVTNDAPLRALVNSRVEVSLTASGDFSGATLGYGVEVNAMRVLGAGEFNGGFTARASGALEARLVADEGIAPAPVVRAVEVYPDALPEARITVPTGDELLREVPSAPRVMRWSARDDLGLASVVLKYIKSRGEGDAAKFTSGEASVGNIERTSGREWRGVASLDLARLDVRAGDTLVFWIEARDRNPDANHTARSSSLAIAIAAPEAARLNLGSLRPPEIGKFLLSERLIIMHTEKLHNERARLNRDELMRRSATIAAEQRDFKNSFNDYTEVEGGLNEMRESPMAESGAANLEERVRENEDSHTEIHNHGIPEPPANSPASVALMVYAMRAMWDAEDALELGETEAALKAENVALANLKRAQAAVRYIPPIRARGEVVDLKRRYAGELGEIKTRLEKLNRRAASKESVPVRAALAEAYAALVDLQATLDAPANSRQGAIARARERARVAANRLLTTGGDHAATIAEAAGQLRIVETELAQLESDGANTEYAARLAKPLALLMQAASSLYALADQSTRAATRDAATTLLPTDNTRAADYFRRLK